MLQRDIGRCRWSMVKTQSKTQSHSLAIKMDASSLILQDLGSKETWENSFIGSVIFVKCIFPPDRVAPEMFWQKTNKSITIQTPAKLNLFLEILGKRPDGFHELETVMTAVELFDQITIELDNTLKPESPTGNSIDLMCRWNHDGQTTPESTSGPESAIPIFGDLPTGPSNLIYRAADRFLNYVKIQQPLN